MIKAGPNMTMSTAVAPSGGAAGVQSTIRTSWDVRPLKNETPGIQKRLCNLLNMNMEQLETIKVIRYQEGQFFNDHFDSVTGADHDVDNRRSDRYNRIVTCFVYLTTNTEGGISQFCNLGGGVREDAARKGAPLDIAPRQGMAVIHFPSFLPGAKNDLGGWADCRVRHRGLPAKSEKFIAAQWAWNVEPHDGNAAKKCSDTVL